MNNTIFLNQHIMPCGSQTIEQPQYNSMSNIYSIRAEINKTIYLVLNLVQLYYRICNKQIVKLTKKITSVILKWAPINGPPAEIG